MPCLASGTHHCYKHKFDIHSVVHRNIISTVKSTRCTNVSNLFHFGMTIYVFQMVFSSIARSSRLYVQQQTDTAVCLLASRQQYLFDKCLLLYVFIYFRKTLYMFRTAFPSIIRSSRLYIQQQTDTAVCLLASRQQYLFDIRLLLYVQSWTPDDGRKDRPKHVQCHSKIK